MDRVKAICQKQLEMYSYKISYALQTGILKGAFIGLKTNYSIPLSKETFDKFEQVLNTKLSGTVEVEHEYTELEWKGLMEIKELIND